MPYDDDDDDALWPGHQMRVAVDPVSGHGALNFMKIGDDDPIDNTFNPTGEYPEVELVFSGGSGHMFPKDAALPVMDIRVALLEWVQARQRPTCVKWTPYDRY